MKKIGVCFLILGSLIISSCTTPGVVTEESNYSIKQHRVAITAAFGLVREISANGRTVYSMFHDQNFKTIDSTGKTKDRYYSKATVLGSIRPYRISVEVIHEKRDPETKSWVAVDVDMELAQKRSDTILELLNQSRDESGTFDEEAPF